LSKRAAAWVLSGFLVILLALLILHHNVVTITGAEALQNKVVADAADPTKGWTFSAASAISGRLGTFLHGNTANRTYITLDISGAIPMLVSSQTPPSDTICAFGGDKIPTLACNNGPGHDAFTTTPFATSYTIPPYFLTQGRSIRLRYGLGVWAPGGGGGGKKRSRNKEEQLIVTLKSGSTALFSHSFSLNSAGGADGIGSILEYEIVGTEMPHRNANVIVEPVVATISGATVLGQGSHTAQPIQLDTSSPQPITLNLAYSGAGNPGNAMKIMYLQVKAE
jgi:hypothetical protein